MSIVDKNRAICSVLSKILAENSFSEQSYYTMTWSGYTTNAAGTDLKHHIIIFNYIPPKTKIDIIDLGNSTVGWGLPLEAFKANARIADYIYPNPELTAKLKYTGPDFDMSKLEFKISETLERINKSKTHVILRTYNFSTGTLRIMDHTRSTGELHYKTINSFDIYDKENYTRDNYVSYRTYRKMVTIGSFISGDVSFVGFA